MQDGDKKSKSYIRQLFCWPQKCGYRHHFYAAISKNERDIAKNNITQNGGHLEIQDGDRKIKKYIRQFFRWPQQCGYRHHSYADISKDKRDIALNNITQNGGHLEIQDGGRKIKKYIRQFFRWPQQCGYRHHSYADISKDKRDIALNNITQNGGHLEIQDGGHPIKTKFLPSSSLILKMWVKTPISMWYLV